MAERMCEAKRARLVDTEKTARSRMRGNVLIGMQGIYPCHAAAGEAGAAIQFTPAIAVVFR
jgi:hypothetical protein